ncbi:hypothetical protein N335_03595, partial [Phaethon lepturus]
HFTPPHNAGAISVVATYSSSLARRVLVFRHIAWKGLSDLPTSTYTRATAVSKAKLPLRRDQNKHGIDHLHNPGLKNMI